MNREGMAKILKAAANEKYNESQAVAKKLKKQEIEVSEFEETFMASRMDYYILKAKETILK